MVDFLKMLKYTGTKKLNKALYAIHTNITVVTKMGIEFYGAESLNTAMRKDFSYKQKKPWRPSEDTST